MATVDLLFMCISAVHGSPGKSFEEVRIDDYLKAYSTTGRPPPPCPQTPTDETRRALMNLPPLFTPYTEASIAGRSPFDPGPRLTNPAELPDAQAFFTSTVDGEIYHTITAIPTYSAFSPEELRYYAYLKGHKFPPTSVPMTPFVPSPPSTNPTAAMTERPTLSMPASLSAQETIVNISAQPEFSGHSPEELRVAFLRAGRELKSQEIINAAASATPAVGTSLFGGSPFSRQPTVRLF